MAKEKIVAKKKAPVKIQKESEACVSCEGRGLIDANTLCPACEGTGKA